MIRIDELSKWFDRKYVLRNVSLTLGDGEIVGLTGPSGSGKSVLLKILGRVIEPDAGSITNTDGGENPSVGFLFQEGALFDSQSVLENVSFPLLNNSAIEAATPYTREEAHKLAYEILGEVGLSNAYLKHPGQLSGGMRRRVALARALVTKPELVLLDDPTGGLDPVAASVIMKLIKRLHNQYNPTILMVSHDLRRLLPTVERTIVLDAGEVVCDEKTEDLEQNASSEVLRFLSTRYDFESAAI